MKMTDHTQDRITLAEAMGWTKGKYAGGGGVCWLSPTGREAAMLPDPEYDANDDYAVLEWMRSDETTHAQFDQFRRMLPFQSEYQIGDYARAALKVIGT